MLLLSCCWTCENEGEGEEIDGTGMMTMISLCKGNVIVIVLLDA